MINIILNYVTCNNTCTIVISTMISMEYIQIYILLHSLKYSLLEVTIVDNRIFTYRMSQWMCYYDH